MDILKMDFDGVNSKCVPRFCQRQFYDRFIVRCISDCAMSVCEPLSRVCGFSVLTGETYGKYAMAIPCQAVKTEGVTTIGSSPSTVPIDTALEVHTNLIF